MILFFVLAMQCPETKIVNYTDVWNEKDQKTLEHTRKRCGEIYPESPCVKTFIKKDETTYNVVCGV